MTAFRSRSTLHAKKKMARTPFMWRRSLIQCLPYVLLSWSSRVYLSLLKCPLLL
jgi:hypothetical protein